MPRAPIFIPPDSLVEFTVRTRKGRSLFRPNRQLMELVHGVIGRALSLFDVRMHQFVFLSNHQHQLLRVADATQACGYIGYVNRNTAIAAKKVTGWNDDVWSHTSIVPILDDNASIARFRYILSNGVKEGLVASPLDWPGPSSTQSLLEGKPIEARWRPARQAEEVEAADRYPIEIHPLPAWSGYPAAHRRRLLEQMIHEVEEAGIASRAGRPVAGVAALRAQAPFEESENEIENNAPIAHTSSTHLLEAFRAQRAAFIDQFRRNRARLAVAQTEATT